MKRGFVLGKFMPPHAGHIHLVEFGLERCDELTVLVCSLPTEPIPGELRFAWMRELFPSARVLHHPDVVPQEPTEHPEFWDIWRELVLERMPHGVDVVFASEEYGARLADELRAAFEPCDLNRSRHPVSGTAVREDPRAQWAHLPANVRRWYAEQE